MKKLCVEKLEEEFESAESSGSNVVALFPRDETQYKILDVKTFMELHDEERLIYLNPFIRKEGIIMITGSSGVGKTMFVLGLCKSLLTGQAFGSWTVETRCNVLYVDGELPVYLLRERIALFGLHETQGFYVMSSMVNKDASFNLINEDFQNAIIKEIDDKNIKLCVFDNLSSLTPGIEENSKSSYDPINQYFLNLRRKGNTIIFIHHTTKGKNEQRGTSGRTDNIDVWCNIEKKSDLRSEHLKLKLNFKKFRYEQSDNLNDNVFILNQSIWAQDGLDKQLPEKQIKLLKLLDEGKSQKEICAILDVTQPYISKMKKIFVANGYLDKKAKLTEDGRKITGIM